MKCECGGELRYVYAAYVIFKQAKVLPNGRLSKRRSEAYRKEALDEYDSLTCQTCNAQYQFDVILETKHVLRGKRLC